MTGKSLCAVLLTALAVGGCGGDDESDRAGAAETGPKPVRVAVVLAALDNAFYVAQKDGVEAQAEKMPGVELSLSAGRQRTASDEVIGLIEDAIAKDVDAIAVNGSDDAPLIPVLRRVIDADIPLVLFDAPADELKGEYATYIGTDNLAGGKAAGEWLANELPDGGEVGMVVCVAAHPVTRARVKGFKQGLGDALKVAAQADANCDREQGRKVMEDMLSAHPKLDAVFSTSDGQAFGAIEALKAVGKDPIFVSFDAQPEAVQAIQAGNVMDASAGWSARELGAEALSAAVAAARGEQVPAERIVPVTVVDKTNAATWNG
jgi:ABC-type sugar transport system substrate-binding protein